MKRLIYQETHHYDLMQGFAMRVDFNPSSNTIFRSIGRSLPYDHSIALEDSFHQPGKELDYEDAMQLRELFVMTRLPLQVPDCVTLDGVEYLLELSGTGSNDLRIRSHGGEDHPAPWQPLTEISVFLRSLYRKYFKSPEAR